MARLTIGTALAEVIELIPRKVRTGLYVAAVVVGAIAFAAQRLVPVWVPELDARVDATVADVTAGALFLIGVLGTAYRPTRTGQTPLPSADPEGYEALYAQEAQARAIATLTGAGYRHDTAVRAVQSGDLGELVRDSERA